MAGQSSWILLCVVILSVGVTTRSLEDYYGYYDYDEALFRRSNQQQDEKENLEIRMPDVHPVKHDSYFCTSMKVSDADTYIVGYNPHAEMHTAHHMLLFGCEVPASQEKSWNCGDMGVGVCRSGSAEKIMYAWGRNAPVLKLPKDVAFKVGGSTIVKYLVLQVHYGHVDKFLKNPSLKDQSGVTLFTTKQRSTHLAGIFLLAAGGSIPAHQKAWHLDVGCQYDNPAVIHPFAFRVHTHKLGTVVSGYRVRNSKWTLIGKNDPQRPQAFYSIENAPEIERGDYLAARCTYNSMSKKRTTYIGATMKDEMCNFYMMFYYDPTSTNSAPEESCGYMPQQMLNYFPADSNVPLPGSGEKMEMKRDYIEDDACPHCKRTIPLLSVKENWPQGGSQTGELPIKAGQVTAVSLDSKGNVVIFHRSSRAWMGDTFDDHNRLAEKYQSPIIENTVAWLDAETGKILREWGAGKFYLPHGLTVDRDNNLWLTDVGLHQVFKYGPGGSDEALITLGTKLIPGDGWNQFCKPTGVAIDSDGSFFVSDGYCNERVLKYTPSGDRITMAITNAAFPASFPRPHSFNIPHSVSLDVQHNQLYMADRENGRVLVFDSKSGKLLNSLTGFGSRVFAAHYDPADGGLLHVVNGEDGQSTVQGYTFSIAAKKTVQTWRPKEGFTEPHDVASNSQGSAVYVAEIGPNRIWKFVQA
ncbi:peptidyl-glycine alpha-amidating monooxygenase B-like isoform X3 [Actinia tenebrosa]|uniref:Peptidyl-glycine alpha-amidating monooxygenase B-like isoform X3 n=1 Tax=Actinia tenebrosa TaxID=6105 RepID=A0A6P8HLI8_ACTTE|nr:peptidyl-glycine alpha-amidating monooxygenase B-like isoform X3 [Actinia tenebrosa]